MTKLKTLKDLNLFQVSIQDIVGGQCNKLQQYPNEYKGDNVLERLKLDRTFVNVEEQRQEAIKHIKSDEHEDIKLSRHTTRAMCNSKHRCNTCEWIKNFFNITEEELKNG